MIVKCVSWPIITSFERKGGGGAIAIITSSSLFFRPNLISLSYYFKLSIPYIYTSFYYYFYFSHILFFDIHIKQQPPTFFLILEGKEKIKRNNHSTKAIYPYFS